MKKSILSYITALIVALPSALQADVVVASSENLQDKVFSVYDSCKNSIVKVIAQKHVSVENKMTKQVSQGSILDIGSGFVVGKDGIVMTSAHITHRSEKLWVQYNNVLFKAKVLGFDPITSISIVKIEGDFQFNSNIVINMNSTSALPKVGSMIVSLSHEMGMPVSPRFGLIMGHNIEFGGNALPTVYVRTSTPAPRGATGGAVFDINGTFLGITIASLPEVNGSFILPAKAAAKIRDDIILCGEPIYSWFGLRAENINTVEEHKVVINFVAENAPAKKAGFLVGDQIIEMNAQTIVSNTQLRDFSFFIRPGETSVFKIKRNEQIIKLEVLAEKMVAEFIKDAESKLLNNTNVENNKK